jgi:hypothetical protein
MNNAATTTATARQWASRLENAQNVRTLNGQKVIVLRRNEACGIEAYLNYEADTDTTAHIGLPLEGERRGSGQSVP